MRLPVDGVRRWVEKKWGTGFGRGLANPATPVPVEGRLNLIVSDPSCELGTRNRLTPINRSKHGANREE